MCHMGPSNPCDVFIPHQRMQILEMNMHIQLLAVCNPAPARMGQLLRNRNSALERSRNPASRRSLPRGELHALRVKPRNSKASRSHLSKRTSNILSAELRPPSRFRWRAVSLPMSASGRPCGASAGRDASPAGRVPLPAWELKRFCPPTPASAAVVLPRAAGCSRDMTGRYGQWQQRGVVRRLLRPGCRAVGRVRTLRAGWNGLRGRGVCGARSRREVPLLLAAGCCLVVPPAGIALRARLRARRSAAPESRRLSQLRVTWTPARTMSAIGWTA